MSKYFWSCLEVFEWTNWGIHFARCPLKWQWSSLEYWVLSPGTNKIGLDCTGFGIQQGTPFTDPEHTLYWSMQYIFVCKPLAMHDLLSVNKILLGCISFPFLLFYMEKTNPCYTPQCTNFDRKIYQCCLSAVQLLLAKFTTHSVVPTMFLSLRRYGQFLKTMKSLNGRTHSLAYLVFSNDKLPIFVMEQCSVWQHDCVCVTYCALIGTGLIRDQLSQNMTIQNSPGPRQTGWHHVTSAQLLTSLKWI